MPRPIAGRGVPGHGESECMRAWGFCFIRFPSTGGNGLGLRGSGGAGAFGLDFRILVRECAEFMMISGHSVLLFFITASYMDAFL